MAGVGQEWTASNGLVQGCPLSYAAQNALMWVLARDLDRLARRHPHVSFFPTFYADDVKVEMYLAPEGAQGDQVAS